MNFITKPAERRRFLFFSIVGALGALVDFTVFNLLISSLGLSAVAASMLSFLAALSSNFVLNRYWTYPDSRSKALRSQLLQYGLVNLIGLAIRTPVLVFARRAYTRWIPGIDLFASQNTAVIADNLALATAIVVVLFWNFFVNRYWTYNDVE